MSPLIMLSILATLMAVDANKSLTSRPETATKNNHRTETTSFTSSLDHQQYLDQKTGLVFELVNTSSSFSHAQLYCQSRFSSITMGKENDLVAMKRLLTQANMQQAIWVGSRPNDERSLSASAQNPSQQNSEAASLSFLGTSQNGYARVEASFPPLSAVTVCLRAQFEPNHKEVSTLFSYAAPLLTNEFQLRGRVDRNQVLLALIIHGQHQSYKTWLPNDGAWHQICVSWRRSDGLCNIYVDGEGRGMAIGVATSRDIYGKGIFILGQDQDSFGGNFTEPFVGTMTDLNIWDMWLNEEQIKSIFTCSPQMDVMPFIKWQDKNLIMHDVVEVQPMTFCPDLQTQEQNKNHQDSCSVLKFNDTLQYDTKPCSDTFPFICKTAKEHYEKRKKLEESLNTNPSTLMKLLRQQGMSTGTFHGGSGAKQTWSSAIHLLNISEEYVHGSGGKLDSRDMPSLVQILFEAAELPAPDNQSHVMAKTLSHSFINIADSLISQENAEKWKNISEVVSGPMTVVQTIDRMVSNLGPLLLEETDQAQIHRNNIRLQVQQKTVSKSPEASEFCVSNATNNSSLDCISIPLHSIQGLHNNGSKKVTLLNAWYGSLTPLLNENQNITIQTTSTNSSYRYKRTVVGSAVISSAVMLEGQLISLGVQFTLRHTNQNESDDVMQIPICAFWDFNLTPENGGGWSNDGCVPTSYQIDSTSCYCNHTTNFALLLQIYDVQRSPETEHALQILTFISCSVSLCGLIVTFILFMAVGVPKSDRTTVHKNLIVALAMAQFLLICSKWATDNQDVCFLVTALLHLFFLSSFCWMLVEGLLLWSKVVSVNISEDHRMRFYYALGWGLPVVIVAITLMVSLKKYKAEKHCWLNTDSNIIWAFAGPVLFILTVNTVVLCRVIMVTVSSARRRAKMLAPSSVSKSRPLDLTWAAMRPVLILMPVLGLTWLCGLLVHLEFVPYLFIVLNAFQGLYIFLVYAVYNTEVRNAIKRIQEKRKALSFTNCSQPASFLPSHKTPGGSWVDSLPTPSSPESSSSSHVTNSTSSSLVIKNESFQDDNGRFSIKPAAGIPEVQLMSFKPLESCHYVRTRPCSSID